MNRVSLLMVALLLFSGYALSAEAGQLILHNKLGSDYEVTHSEVGENGSIVGSPYAYETGVDGLGYVRKGTSGGPRVQFPGSVLHGLNFSGSLEVTIVPKVPEPCPYNYGFFALVGQSVSGPTVPVNRGNVYLYWGDTVTGTGLYGGVRFDNTVTQTPSEPTQFVTGIGKPFTASMSWDISGIDGSMDTIRVYRNGTLVGSTTSPWDPNGAVLEEQFLVGTSPDAGGFNRFITDDIKVWDYAKTDFAVVDYTTVSVVDPPPLFPNCIPEPASLVLFATGGMTFVSFCLWKRKPERI